MTTLYRLPKVMELTGYGKSSIYKLAKAGKFPAPITLAGGGAVAWRASDIEAWIAVYAGPGTATPALAEIQKAELRRLLQQLEQLVATVRKAVESHLT